MKTDKELLELAAKAVGIDIEYRHGGDSFYYDDEETGREQWNPLDNDGQALRLAVKLGIWTLNYSDDDWEYCNQDGYAATRRAIVRAAAAIGERL